MKANARLVYGNVPNPRDSGLEEAVCDSTLHREGALHWFSIWEPDRSDPIRHLITKVSRFCENMTY